MNGLPTLQAKGVTKHFDGITALDDVSLELRGGEILGLFGPNGAGKTTLFNVVSGALAPDRGDIILAGESTLGIPGHRVARKGVTRTFQNLKLIRQASVLDNLLLFGQGHPGESLLNLFLRFRTCSRVEKQLVARAKEVLSRIGLEGHAKDNAGALSYGQQKLLSIGCCLMAQARVLLLDEPVSGIAPEMAEKVLELVSSSIGMNQSAIVIEHNMDALLSISTRMVFMDAGRIVCSGAPSEVMANDAVINAYLR